MLALPRGEGARHVRDGGDLVRVDAVIFHDVVEEVYVGAFLPGLLAKKSGKTFRVGIFLDFASSSTRTPHGADVQMSGRDRIDSRWGGIERLAARTLCGCSDRLCPTLACSNRTVPTTTTTTTTK